MLMYHRFFVLISSFLLASLVVGCASIPMQTQIVYAPDSDIRQVQAECVSGHSAVATAQPVRSVTRLNAARISLLNWNVYKGQGKNWAANFKDLLAGQDIVVLQEALLSDRLHQLLGEKDLYWNLNAAFLYDEMESGVLTASKVEPVSSCGVRTAEPVIRIPKTILFSQYPLNDRSSNLLVANIHGINFTLGTGAYKEQIAALSKAIRNHPGPVIVAGDFNSWTDERMEIVNQMRDELLLKAVAYKNHNRSTIFGNVIDHVFYSGLELIEEKTIKVTSSDHNPISVTFRALPIRFAKLNNE